MSTLFSRLVTQRPVSGHASAQHLPQRVADQNDQPRAGYEKTYPAPECHEECVMPVPIVQHHRRLLGLPSGPTGQVFWQSAFAW